ncbi:MAG: hypothetical protein WB561_06805 [Terracidiphilus sp.]
MVRYLVSLKWDGFIRSTVIAAFEAYGSALVGITPSELPADSSNESSTVHLHAVERG